MVPRKLPVLVAALAAGCGGEVASAPPAHEARTLATQDGPLRLRVRNDRVGVVFDEAADDSSTTPLVPLLPPGATHAPPAAGSSGLHAVLHLVDPSGSPDGDGLADVAHDMLRRNPGTLEHAGVVVEFEGCPDPVLMTHEVVVQFHEAVTEAEIVALLAQLGLVEGVRSAFVPNLMLVETPPESDDDALEACERLNASPLVDFSEPNFVHAIEYTSVQVPDDPLLACQWHHDNDGAGSGTFDADIDSIKAWRITTGSPDVVIAVLEDGFDAGHPDLAPNLWSAPGDPTVHGWNFEDDDANLLGDPDSPGATSHGTCVAGCAAARGGNGIGVSGSAPNCRLMLLRRRAPTDYFRDSEALHWAWHNGADVITNSWTYSRRSHVPQVVKRAIAAAITEGRDGKGAVVLFSTRNTNVDVASAHDIAAVPGVLTVSSVTNTDERTRACGRGVDVDVLGPSRLSSAPSVTEGTLDVVTTDWRGWAVGYNYDRRVLPEKSHGFFPCSDLPGEPDYTACFGGTSAATPIVAGVVGLVLSVAPELTREQVHRLICDTTDRVEHSKAVYDPITGRSTKKTHGYGRVNAFEAVRVVAPTELGGRGGVDLFVRDHALDWGNTEQPSWLLFERERGAVGPYSSPDVRVDAPPFAAAPTSSADFDALPFEAAAPGKQSRVYVRVRNRGPRPSGAARVRVFWTESSAVLPDLPADFWTAGAPGESVPASGPAGTWRALGARAIANVPYSSCAGLYFGGGGEPALVAFPFAAPDTAGVEGRPQQYALLVLVDGDDDPAGGDAAGTLDVLALVALDNDAALSNRLVTTAAEPLIVRLSNPGDHDVRASLEVVEAGLDHVGFELVHAGDAFAVVGDFPLTAGEELLLRVRLGGSPGTAELRQRIDGALVGGAVLTLVE